MNDRQDKHWVLRTIKEGRINHVPLWQDTLAVGFIIALVLGLLWFVCSCFSKTDNLVDEVMVPEVNAYMQKPPLKSEIETVLPEKPKKIIKKKTRKSTKKGKWSTFEVTFYCACRRCCGRNSDGRTASNKRVRFGYCANNRYKFGTKIEFASSIRGSKIFRVEDRGGRAFWRWNRIDVYIPNHAKAKKMGRRKIKGRIVK